MKIAFIGNFIPPYSTENDRKWSFEKLGHKVITFQENEVSVEVLRRHKSEYDVLFYSHTHDPSYVIPGLKEWFKECKLLGIPTVSVHLDRWLGLARAKDMGHEATWFTEYIFMADGSLEAAREYERLGLNWHYLRPGVVERDCYMAQPDRVRFPHEIIFVGSKGYHPEYPFRPKLIEFLHKTYGSRFGHYGNDGIRVVRGHDLNVLYASAKIAVGDSCFGGRPNYVSDRYYETRGRGGFLMHPFVDGVDHEGVGDYDLEVSGNKLVLIKGTIDMFLEDVGRRESMREKGFNHVKQHETYTNRAQEMLDIIFR